MTRDCRLITATSQLTLLDSMANFIVVDADTDMLRLIFSESRPPQQRLARAKNSYLQMCKDMTEHVQDPDAHLAHGGFIKRRHRADI